MWSFIPHTRRREQKKVIQAAVHYSCFNDSTGLDLTDFHNIFATVENMISNRITMGKR